MSRGDERPPSPRRATAARRARLTRKSGDGAGSPLEAPQVGARGEESPYRGEEEEEAQREREKCRST